MPYGRGGAGNIISVEQKYARADVDLETNQPEIGTDCRKPSSLYHIQRDDQQYAHAGRGGMGNYYSPRQLSERGYFSDVNGSLILCRVTQPPGEPSERDSKAVHPSHRTDQPSADLSRRIGRGGAGNMAFGVGAVELLEERKKKHQQQVQHKLRLDIEREVAGSLAVPEKAKLSGTEPS